MTTMALAGDLKLREWREGEEGSERGNEGLSTPSQGLLIGEVCEGELSPLVRTVDLNRFWLR